MLWLSIPLVTYVVGLARSPDFPLKNPIQANYGGGGSDAFISKLNATGTALVYSTYIGGSSEDAATAVTVDSEGNAYVTGTTASTNFPVTPGVLQTSSIGGFVLKLDPAGSSLVYSLVFASIPTAIAVDSTGCAYIAGGAVSYQSMTTPGAYQSYIPGGSALLTKF
jgi:hypothetical protein